MANQPRRSIFCACWSKRSSDGVLFGEVPTDHEDSGQASQEIATVEASEPLDSVRERRDEASMDSMDPSSDDVYQDILEEAMTQPRMTDDGVQQDYDTLPPRSLVTPMLLQSQDSIYDAPRKLTSVSGDDYDIPRAHLLIAPPTSSNRSSTVSMLSTGSSGLSHRSSLDAGHEMYDVLPAPRVKDVEEDIYDTPPKARMVARKKKSEMDKDPSYQEISEIPLKSEYDDYAVPSSDEPCSSGDSGYVAHPKGYETLSSVTKSLTPDIYDIPAKDVDGAFQRLQMSDSGAVYDVPPQVTKDSSGHLPADWADHSEPEPYEPLLLEAETALEVLARLQQDVHTSASRLLSHVCKHWRSVESLDAKLSMIKLSCMSVKTSLQEYLEFGQGVLATAQNVLPPEERSFSIDMNSLLDPLLEAQLQIRKSLKSLDALQWNHESLIRSDDALGDDDLDRVVRTAKGIPINARSLTLLIQGNAKRLFRVASPQSQELTPQPSSPPTKDDSPIRKPPPPPLRPKPKLSSVSSERSPSMRDRPLPVPPKESPTEPLYNELSDKQPHNYDYVHLAKQSSQESVKSGDALLADVDSLGDPLRGIPSVRTSGLSPSFRERLEKLQLDAEKPVQVHDEASTYEAPQLHENDVLILTFYANEVNTHVDVLLNAIDAFMKCVDYNQPPKVFIAHSKFVILAAHKLVYIGDTISRNLLNDKLRQCISAKGNALCDALKATVVGTKNAALNYPSVSITQQMTDKVSDVSRAAEELKKVITSASGH